MYCLSRQYITSQLPQLPPLKLQSTYSLLDSAIRLPKKHLSGETMCDSDSRSTGPLTNRAGAPAPALAPLPSVAYVASQQSQSVVAVDAASELVDSVSDETFRLAGRLASHNSLLVTQLAGISNLQKALRFRSSTYFHLLSF